MTYELDKLSYQGFFSPSIEYKANDLMVCDDGSLWVRTNINPAVTLGHKFEKLSQIEIDVFLSNSLKPALKSRLDISVERRAIKI